MLIPPVMIYRARGMTSRRPRLHVVPDMDWQYRYEAQEEGPNLGTEKEPVYLFPDVSSNRSQIPGTVEWKDANVNDVEFLTGIAAGSEIPSSLPIPTTKEKREQDEPKKSEPQKSEPGADGTQQEKPVEPEPDWVTSLPKSITVNREFMERGRDRFNIYCVVCHGYSGNGDGLVNRRAMELALIGKSAWTTAKSFHDAEVVKQPVGRIFNTITNGRGTMGPYKDQITAEDRWAIALYVKALQETRKDWVNPESPPASKPAADEKGGDKKSTGQSKKKTAENDKADRGKTEKQPKQNDSGTEKSGNPNDGLAWRKQRN
jgi:mono/diheme cytochrome c family protein